MQKSWNMEIHSHRINLNIQYYKQQSVLSLLFRLMTQTFSAHSPKSQAITDWICFNCNNLNYSFRKICNRCKSITREQNHQNYLHLQYLHLYYQQTCSPIQENRKSLQPVSSFTLEQDFPNLARAKSEKNSLEERKESTTTSEALENWQIKSQQWSNTESQRGFLFLLDNAWEGLYNNAQISEFKCCEQTEETRQQDEPDEGEDILTNFDFTFI